MSDGEDSDETERGFSGFEDQEGETTDQEIGKGGELEKFEA